MMSDIVLWPDVAATPNSLVSNALLLKLGIDIGEVKLRSRLAPHWHDYFQLWYVVDGAVVHTVDGVTYRQTAGTLVSVLPYRTHSYDCSMAPTLPKIISIGIDDSFLTNAGIPFFSYDSRSACFEGFHIPTVTHISDKSQADAIVEAMCREYYKNSDMSTDAIRGMLYAFLLLAYSQNPRQQASGSIRERGELVAMASRYISRNCRENLLINDICPMTMMSRRLFTDCFKGITGATFSEYTQAARMHLAHSRISISDDTLADIAEMSGFSSKSHLSRKFSEFFGMSPVTYRELSRLAALATYKNARRRAAWLDDLK